MRRNGPAAEDYSVPCPVRDMPGGEGSPINLLDQHHHRRRRASTADGDDAAASSSMPRTLADDDAGTAAAAGANLLGSGGTMTSALTGDGLRRRKVIHAAKETLDKGESRGARLFRLSSLLLLLLVLLLLLLSSSRIVFATLARLISLSPLSLSSYLHLSVHLSSRETTPLQNVAQPRRVQICTTTLRILSTDRSLSRVHPLLPRF